jgi:hypothetical protein
MEHAWIELARVTVAVVLVVSGVQKLRHPGDLAWWPRPIPLGLAALLPVAELAVAAALLAVGGPVPLVLAAGLFAAFTAVAARAQRTDVVAPSCGCLGGGLRLDAGWLLAGLDALATGLLVVAAAAGGGAAIWAGDSVTAAIAVALWGALAGAVFWIAVYAYSIARAARAAAL